MKDIIKETLAFKDLTAEEKAARGILGRLYGPIADIINPTRNGRAYSEELWDKVFNENEIVKEMFDNGGIFGELDHPADRQELCSEKIAICMPEPPKKDKDGHLIGYFDILDTPCGRIAYALAKYGYKLGISSRGNGDVLSDDSVDPDTYEFTCFDLVIIPSVKDARLKMTEGLDMSKVNFTKALTESLDNASADERKVMEETLNNLNIEIKESAEVIPEENKEETITEEFVVLDGSEEELERPLESGEVLREEPDTETNAENGCIDCKADTYKVEESIQTEQTADNCEDASNAGSDIIVESLQNALNAKAELETKVQTLQNQLAVTNSKVAELEEELTKYKAGTARLSTLVTESKAKAERVFALEETLKSKELAINTQKDKIAKLEESISSDAENAKSLNEAISNKDEQINALTEKLNSIEADHQKQVTSLEESYKQEITAKDSDIKTLKEQLAKSTSKAESYKKLSNNIVDSYIQCKAAMIDVDPNEIKNKLPQNYTLSNIDTICESLRKYALNVNKLPFNIDRKVKKVEVSSKTNESLKPSNPEIDDEVDELTLKMAHII